jgi:hypothetical protein
LKPTRRERRAIRIAAAHGDLAARAKVNPRASRDRLIAMLEAKQVTFDARVREAEQRVAALDEGIRVLERLLESRGEVAPGAPGYGGSLH